VALGGVPNVIATDEKGNGVFKRDLGFCAMEKTASMPNLFVFTTCNR
jgi:hypothetical protein